jgi:hypothetical protein
LTNQPSAGEETLILDDNKMSVKGPEEEAERHLEEQMKSMERWAIGLVDQD